MRSKPVWASLGLAVVALVAWMLLGSPISSQDSVEDPQRPASSAESGRVFDFEGQQAFLSQLSAEERARLIKLYSRFALADAACPLPQAASDVFYVKFHQPLDAAFAGRLRDAGAAFVGYANPNTHFIRARDAASLAAIGDLLTGNDNVAGTRPHDYVDKFSPEAWGYLNRNDWTEREFRLRFWADKNGGAKKAVLLGIDAKITYAHLEADGSISERVPYVDAVLTPLQLRLLAVHPDVEWIQPRFEFETRNVVSAALANASANVVGVGTSYNLTGDAEVAVVFDAGTARATHTDFQNANSTSPFTQYFSGMGSRRVLIAPQIASQQPGWGMPDNSSVHYHAAHVTGTVVGDGTGQSQAQGFAPKAYAVSMGWGSMEFERQVLRHYFRHVADNHSYGTTGSMGGYDSSAQASDVDIRDILLNMSKSAGNSGGSGSMTTSGDTNIKNAFVIAATEDNGDIAGFSSRGPTADGRLIPHFAANGVGLTSTWNTSDTAYSSISGTSMSAPSVTGALVLLNELWHREFNGRPFSPDELRAVLAATCNDRYNQGPDYRFGFGIVDIKRAADLILAHSSSGSHIRRGSIRQGDTNEYSIEVTNANEPLKVVLSWLDIYASTAAATKLVNNLDLELVAPDTSIHHPWSGLSSGSTGNQTYQWTRTGANNRDNILLAEVDNPMTGTWIVRVKGTSIPSNPQATVLNDSTGFALVCERPINKFQSLHEDSLNTSGPVNIPDGNTIGLVRTFSVTNASLIENVRVYVDVRHPRRGDIEIVITHPDSSSAVIETADTSTRPDIIGIFPDTRQYDDDLDVFLGKSANGTWSIAVKDLNANSQTGTLEWLALEIDFEGNGTNQAPVAGAGPNQLVDSGMLVQLNGSASSDPENDPLTYAWVQTSGPFVPLTGADTATPSFTAPIVPVTTDCVFQLTVDDGRGGQDSDTVTVTVEPPNIPPVADAGADFLIVSGQQGNLNGSASSDPNGDPLTYLWTEIGSSLLNLSQSDVANPTFIAPSVATVTQITMQLTVDDGRGGQDSDTVTVTIEPPNTPPVANAGLNRTVTREASVVLNASGSTDADNDPLTFLWSQTAGNNTVVLNGANAAVATFTAPAQDDVLVFTVLVDDGRGGQDSHSVTITVSGPLNSGSGGSGGGDDGGCSMPGSSGALWILLVAAFLGWLPRRNARRKLD